MQENVYKIEKGNIMLTAKDIREVKFNRSMGGYKTAEVDEFLDRCADVVEELTNQNNENARKMQVLAETIVDYRNQEDSIRSALISAQRMSESVISDARKQADDILTAARNEASALHEKALQDTAAEQEELRRVRQEVADFKAKLLSIYREHLTMIGVLEDAPEQVEEPVKAAPAAPVKEVVEPVTAPMDIFSNMGDTREMPDFSAFELKDDE